MNQIDGDVLVVGGDDDYGLDDGLDGELLGINIDSLAATRDIEKEEDDLRKVIEGLVSIHMATSLPFSDEQLGKFFMNTFWSDTFAAEKTNVRLCVVERTTQLAARNRKSVMMDSELCWSFAVDSSDNLVEQSLIFQLCHEFIRISWALRYSPHQESLPTFIKQNYSMDSN